ncbi:hypothetical protein IQ06DRAFT_18913 [Phaeosphaeriaceae sp. SRC1lsM3a]|nr:hypothetical protein IQ06DRAFT_18913 [Stagonospora sp. SRC1lsM3a]
MAEMLGPLLGFGVALGLIPLEVVSFSQDYSSTITTLLSKAKEYGFVTSFLLHTVLVDALLVIHFVELYVLRVEDAQVIIFMQPYGSSFNMIGVAVCY